MKNLKKLIIPGALAISLVGATTAFAFPSNAGNANYSNMQSGSEFRGCGGRGGFMSNKDREAAIEARDAAREERRKEETKIIESADNIVPGLKTQWETSVNAMDEVRTQFREKMDEIHEQLDNGELTREELHEKMPMGGRMGKGDFNSNGIRPADSWNELETAVEEENADNINSAFNTIMEHINDRISFMTERLKAFK